MLSLRLLDPSYTDFVVLRQCRTVLLCCATGLWRCGRAHASGRCLQRYWYSRRRSNAGRRWFRLTVVEGQGTPGASISAPVRVQCTQDCQIVQPDSCSYDSCGAAESRWEMCFGVLQMGRRLTSVCRATSLTSPSIVALVASVFQDCDESE